MTYLKYTPYIYLIAAVFFTIRAVETWSEDNNEHFLFIGIAILSVFMFFFRRKFAKKLENSSNKKA